MLQCRGSAGSAGESGFNFNLNLKFNLKLPLAVAPGRKMAHWLGSFEFKFKLKPEPTGNLKIIICHCRSGWHCRRAVAQPEVPLPLPVARALAAS